jgi:hypothetical protein
MHVPMWEWLVSGGARDGTTGLSGTRHGAMDALSRTLIEGHGNAIGYVAPIVLMTGVSGSFYMRGNALDKASYDSGVIRWEGGGWYGSRDDYGPKASDSARQRHHAGRA